MIDPKSTRYSAIAQLLHWATAILVVVSFTYGLGGPPERVYSAALDFERQLHETLGLSVFVLTLLRLSWLAMDTRPPKAPMPNWMLLASSAVQVSLYILLLAVPLSAVLGAWLEGHPLTLLLGCSIEPMIAPAQGLGSTIANVHTWLGDALIWLAGLHAAAGVYHHVWLKDGVLLAMLPTWFPLRKR